MLRCGIYRDKHGDLLKVRRTATGYIVTRPDGSTTTVGLRADADGAPMRRPNGSPVVMRGVRP